MVENCAKVGVIELKTASRYAFSLGRPRFCGGVVDVNGRGVLRVAVDNIDGVLYAALQSHYACASDGS